LDQLIQVRQSVILPTGDRSTEHEDFLHDFSTDEAHLPFRQHSTGKRHRSVSRRAGFDGEHFGNEKTNNRTIAGEIAILSSGYLSSVWSFGCSWPHISRFQTFRRRMRRDGALMHAYCDFDGTIATIDVTDAVLERFAAPEWRDIEAAWEAGRIDARQCMSAQITLIQAAINQIDEFLDTVEIDPEFPEFVRWCLRNSIPVTVVSDGVDRFIHRVLSNHGLDHLDIIANHLCVENNGNRFHYRLEAPFTQSACKAGSGVCKCAIVASHTPHIYVGDGRSDFCVSANADLLFAKHKLATHCASISIPFVSYTTFKDVQTEAATQLLHIRTANTAASHLSKTA
jgi:2,3-diketo-5-methylthio-1-phosphopentane phosphatase